ncbi:MAG TPA: hypothetical protein VNN06_18725 [Ramlibacter sp.]|nr:hypothetical protein [Ramlibacter sp.]
MGILRTALACALAFAALPVAIPSFAQPADASCIVAGRIASGRWAPRMAGVQLLAQDGKAVASPDKQALTGVRQVRLTRPALLSRCDGDRELALGDDAPATKSPVPAASAGLLPVESVGYPKLRTGGELVELKLTVPTERVVTLTR